MKRINKFSALFLIVLSSFAVNSCTDGFEELNTNPRTIGVIEPQQLFYRAQTEQLTIGHAYSSIWYAKLQWMQYGTPHTWFTAEANMSLRWTYFQTGIGNTLYSEYNNMGAYITTIENLVEKSDSPDKYSDLVQMGRILLIAKAIQTSDMWGSLAYSEAWLARKGMVDDKSMTPSFQSQEELVAIWDNGLKECIQKLQARLNATDKVSLAGIDRAYNGNPQKWIKAANAIRLRLASRLWKIQPATAKAIATEVLSPGNSGNVFAGIDDSFILWFDNLYTTIHSGDWHSSGDLNRASATIMNYLNKYGDPRRPIYFRPNNLTQENIAIFNEQQKTGLTIPGVVNIPPRQNPYRMIPPSFTQYEGAVMSFDRRRALPDAPAVEPGPGQPPVSGTQVAPLLPNRANYPDDAAYNAAYDAYYDNWDFEAIWKHPEMNYDRRYLSINAFLSPPATTTTGMVPACALQVRLWQGINDTGTGGNWAPVMTYADFCYLAAEFVLREGIPSDKSAQGWYEAGLRGSLDQWNALGNYCRVHNYTAMTEEEITTFLNQNDIKWDGRLEQIYAQTYVEHYKNVDEAWAFWKRTGYPSPSSEIIPFERVMVSNIERFIPRRARFTIPLEGVHNYENLKKRIEDMAKDPKFGDPLDEFGRLWWDVE